MTYHMVVAGKSDGYIFVAGIGAHSTTDGELDFAICRSCPRHAVRFLGQLGQREIARSLKSNENNVQ